MEALAIAVLSITALLGLAASIAGTESRDGFDGLDDDPDRRAY